MSVFSGFFGIKKNKQLETLLQSLRMNVENNYKDASLSDLRAFSETFEEYLLHGKLTEKQAAYYQEILDDFRKVLKNYGHNDQKPYWTKEEDGTMR